MGNRITAANKDKEETRDKNQYDKKVLHPHPDALKPSWERGQRIKATPHTTFREDALMLDLSENDSPGEAKSNSNTDFVATDRELQQEINQPANDDLNLTNGQSPVRVDEDMTAHMERLFAQAERALQETVPTEEGRVTRSAGRSLHWNPEMNSTDILVERN